ncbi:MAG: phospho-N-acetylmuramoyl-pentapeptide-transferase [Alphaproteobacteria bacterium]|nr:phospho-N-acetylmuramoyl-pentapeptide-transferase [Alphaproteobacteria bacterium]
MLFYLSRFSEQFGLLNVFKYQTFRMGGALLVAFFLTLWIGPKVIMWLKKKEGEGQPIRDCGPATHLSKKGTPTMGGLMILIAGTLSALLWADWASPYLWILLAVFWGFGIVGGVDDYLKLTHHNSDGGVAGKTRLLIEFTLAFIACLGMIKLAGADMKTTLTIPFFKNFLIDLGYFYIPFAMFVMVGAANSVNLTDGLDGLVSFPVIMCVLVFMVIAYVCSRADFANYLQIVSIPLAKEIPILCGAIIGATLGFLWYNAHPAQVFMGDTGSLALGGFLGALSVATKHEIVLAIAGAIFVVEALSVMIQVGSFKLRGKRVFLMAPIHHHFEKLGWSETTVVTRFWIISIVLALMALATLKLR